MGTRSAHFDMDGCGLQVCRGFGMNDRADASGKPQRTKGI